MRKTPEQMLAAKNIKLQAEIKKLNDALAVSNEWMDAAIARRKQIKELQAEAKVREAKIQELTRAAEEDKATIDRLLSLGDKLLNILATRKDSSGLPGFQGEVLSIVMLVIDRWITRHGFCTGIRPGVAGRLDALEEQVFDKLQRAHAAQSAAEVVLNGNSEDMASALSRCQERRLN
jgi:hypothetical protein